MVTFPSRNLGVAERWGRVVEDATLENLNTLELVNQSFGNLQRTSAAQDGIISRQIEELGVVLEELRSAQHRISATIATGVWDDTVAGNAWGELIEVDPPEWASSAIVIGSMYGFTFQSSPWSGQIELIASASPPDTGDVAKSRDVAMALAAGETFPPTTSNPRLVDLYEDGMLYLRARGIRQSGTTARTYSFTAAYAIIWS